LPEFHQSRNSKLKTNSEYLISHADVLITTSSFLQKTLTTNYHSKRVCVVPLGVDPLFLKNKNVHKSSNPYFLFVGTIKASKNIPVILEAFTTFLKKYKMDCSLLFVGSDIWRYAHLRETAKKLEITDRVRFVPSIDN